MGLPTVVDNLQGYENGQLLNKVDNIKTKMYYLIHGTLDDNVHYQQSLMLAKVLEQKDILFRQQVNKSLLFSFTSQLFIFSFYRVLSIYLFQIMYYNCIYTYVYIFFSFCLDVHRRRPWNSAIANTSLPLVGKLFR